MRCMRLAICMAVFACLGGLASAEDMDVKAIQAKLAAQEARINDLQAKMNTAACEEGVVADGLTSLRKNAVVTIGGTVNTRYFYRSGSVKSDVVRGGAWDMTTTPPSFTPSGSNPAGMRKVADARGGDLFIADAKLEGKIDVNDYFDAYFKFDLQSSDDESSDNAEQYWVRWKNIANSGFGILVGRDDLKYGMGPSVGVLDSWSASSDTNGYGGMFSDFMGTSNFAHTTANGYLGGNYSGDNRMIHESGTPIPMHTGWDYSRVTQINPYWENCDGSLRMEVSFIQDLSANESAWHRGTDGSYVKYRKSPNDGFGSMTGRVTWKPLEGLTLVASVMNQYNKYAPDEWGDDAKKNNFAASLGFEYTPTFLCDKLTLWGYYQHAWNEAWVEDMDSDLVNAGIKFDITDQFYAFAQGDFLYVKDKKADLFHKATGWAGYAGFGYVLPYGANFEAGYRHEKVDYKDSRGHKHTKYKGDTVYAHLGFNF